jgi:hypothetical protein
VLQIVPVQVAKVVLDLAVFDEGEDANIEPHLKEPA